MSPPHGMYYPEPADLIVRGVAICLENAFELPHVEEVPTSLTFNSPALAWRIVGLCFAWFWEHELQEETSLLIAVPRMSDQHQRGLFKGK